MLWFSRHRRAAVRGFGLERASRFVAEGLENRLLLAVNFNAPIWIEQGPSIVKGDTAGETAGAVNTIATPINNADIAWVGTTKRGAFLGENLTTTARWTQLTSTFSSQSIGALEVSRFRPGVRGGALVSSARDPAGVPRNAE